MTSPYAQDDARVRMEWGPVGADVMSPHVEFAVVVDVLSFTTALTVAMDRGVEVFPYQWRDESAVSYARAHDATLAVGRLEAREAGDMTNVSLSPHTVRAARDLSRLVLPSPNGSTICFRLAASGVRVLGASLRNSAAVAQWLADQLKRDDDAAVTVIAAGERWHDDTLRPAVEDLWGAGAVIAGLREHGLDAFSPEAHAAEAAFQAAGPSWYDALMRCSSGRELDEATFGAEVAVAAELHTSTCVPLLIDGRFVDASEG